MVGRFLILIFTLITGSSYAETTSDTTTSTSDTKVPVATIGEIFAEVFQTAECGLNCGMLLQQNPPSDTDPTTTQLNDLYSQLVSHYNSLYTSGKVVYFTMKQLKEEINFQQDIFDKMQKVGIDPNNAPFTKIADDLTASIKAHKASLTKMESENLVLSITDNQASYLTIEDYKYQMKKQKKQQKVESLLKESMTSKELFDLYDALTELDEVLKSDDFCSINEEDYTYTDLASYMDSVLDLAHDIEHQERVQSAVDTITLQYSSAGQYWLKSEVKDFLDSWDSLIKLLDPDETVSIMSTAFTLSSSKEKYEELKGVYQKIHIGEVATFDLEGNLQVIPAPLVTSSNSMTGADYMDLVKAAAGRKKDVPVVAIDEAEHGISNSANTMTLFSGTSDPGTFLQVGQQSPNVNLERDPTDYPKYPQSKGAEYKDGDLSFVFVTAFLTGQNSTGKLYAFDGTDADTYVELLRGFDRPTGSCYDVNHNFLYMVENGGPNPGIYQFQVTRGPQTIQFTNSIFVVVYTGTPLDCKVDAYGNLYFTEETDQTIRKITYSDLFFAYINTDIIVISKTIDTDIPSAFELINSGDLYYVNSGSSGDSGTINKVNVALGVSDKSPIKVMVQESPLAKGIAMTSDIIFYSLSNGAIKSYDINSGEIYTYSRELENPIGLCTSGQKVFAMDYSAGAVYVGSNIFSENMKIFAYIQAPYSCFCLNYDDAGLALQLLFSVFAIFSL